MISKSSKIIGYLFAGMGLFILVQLPVLADGYWDWWGETQQSVKVSMHWFALLILTAVVFSVLLKIYRHGFQRYAIFRGFTWRMAGLAVLIAVLSVAIEMGLMALFASATESGSSEIVALIHGRLGILTLVCANLISPVLEELLFRGIIQSFFTRYFQPLVAVIVTNALFALGHGYGLAATMGTFVVGCGLSWLVIKTQRLGTAMLGHICVNWLVTIINIYL